MTTPNNNEQNPETQTSFADLPDIPESTKEQFKVGLTKCPYPGCNNKFDPNDSSQFLRNPETNELNCLIHFEKCINCSDTFFRDNMITHNGDWYCEECFNELYATCPNCSEVVEVNEILEPTNSNRYSLKHGGCTECCAECDYCKKVIDKEDSSSFEGDYFCEDCFSDTYFVCNDCGEIDHRDNGIYVDDVGELCEQCFFKNYIRCEECDKIIENSDAIEHDSEYYCQECGEKFTATGYFEYTDNFDKFTYTKKDKYIRILLKLLPISGVELKTTNSTVADGLQDLIILAQGEPITIEMVKKYRDSLHPEELSVGYTVWDGCQRSIDNLHKNKRPAQKPQLVMNILASPQMLTKLHAKEALYDLFNKINTASDRSGHPYIKDQIGWTRLEPDPNGEFILVDETQCDHSNACFQIKSLQDYNKVEKFKAQICNDLGLRENSDELYKSICDPSVQTNKSIIKIREIYKRKFSLNDKKLNRLIENKENIANIEKNIIDNRKHYETMLGENISETYVYQQQKAIRKMLLLPELQEDKNIKDLRNVYKKIYEVNDDKLNKLIKDNVIRNNVNLPEVHRDTAQVGDKLKKQYGLDDDSFDKLLSEYLSLVSDFPNIAIEAISKFARENKFKKIFWHTYESGMALKQNEPPKSLYEKTPKENFFLPSSDRPFDLEGQFFEREAQKTYKLYKLAKIFYFKYLR